MYIEYSAAATQQALDSASQGSSGLTPGSSTECQDALSTLFVSCTPIQNNPQIFCTGQCKQYYDVIKDCDPTVMSSNYIV